MYRLALSFCRRSATYFPITLHRHNEVALDDPLDEHHIIGGGIPGVVEHKAKADAVAVRLPEHCAVMLILAHRRPSFGLAVGSSVIPELY